MREIDNTDIEMASSNNNSSIPHGEGEVEEDQTDNPPFTRLYFRLDPKDAAKVLCLYPVYMGAFTLVFVKILKHTFGHTSGAFIISFVAYAMAFMGYLILSWMNNRSSIIQQHNIYSGCFWVTQVAFYILCSLAYLSPLPALFIPQH